MMNVKRHFESIARAPRAHGIAMASYVGGTQCGLQYVMHSVTHIAFSPANAGVVKTL